MIENNERIDQLLARLETLLRKQDFFSYEINVLKKEIEQLKFSEETQQSAKKLEGQETIKAIIETPESSIKVPEITKGIKSF
jgi:hypothetical protein